MKPFYLLSVFCVLPLAAQQHELTFSLGGVTGMTRQNLDLGTGTGLGANYAFRLVEGGKASLYLETQLLSSPLRDVSSTQRSATRDFATLYLTEGLRVKFAPRSRVSPFGLIGGGWALYEQSTTRLDGQPNSAPRRISRGALMFGGGADFQVWKAFSLRGEVRDFYTGSPAFNTGVRGGQHNVVPLAGIVIRWK